MANPTDITTSDMATLKITTVAEVSVIVNPRRKYTIEHNGQNSSGGADTNTVYCSTTAAPDTDASEADDKKMLFDNRAFEVGPGLATLKFKMGAGEVTVGITATGPK